MQAQAAVGLQQLLLGLTNLEVVWPHSAAAHELEPC